MQVHRHPTPAGTLAAPLDAVQPRPAVASGPAPSSPVSPFQPQGTAIHGPVKLSEASSPLPSAAVANHQGDDTSTPAMVVKRLPLLPRSAAQPRAADPSAATRMAALLGKLEFRRRSSLKGPLPSTNSPQTASSRIPAADAVCGENLGEGALPASESILRNFERRRAALARFQEVVEAAEKELHGLQRRVLFLVDKTERFDEESRRQGRGFFNRTRSALGSGHHKQVSPTLPPTQESSSGRAVTQSSSSNAPARRGAGTACSSHQQPPVVAEDAGENLTAEGEVEEPFSGEAERSERLSSSLDGGPSEATAAETETQRGGFEDRELIAHLEGLRELHASRVVIACVRPYLSFLSSTLELHLHALKKQVLAAVYAGSLLRNDVQKILYSLNSVERHAAKNDWSASPLVGGTSGVFHQSITGLGNTAGNILNASGSKFNRMESSVYSAGARHVEGAQLFLPTITPAVLHEEPLEPPVPIATIKSSLADPELKDFFEAHPHHLLALCRFPRWAALVELLQLDGTSLHFAQLGAAAASGGGGAQSDGGRGGVTTTTTMAADEILTSDRSTMTSMAANIMTTKIVILIFQWIKFNPFFYRLHLEDCLFSSENWQQVIASSVASASRLTEFSLVRCPLQTAQDSQVLFSALRTNPIEMLQLSYCALNQTACQQLAEALLSSAAGSSKSAANKRLQQEQAGDFFVDATGTQRKSTRSRRPSPRTDAIPEGDGSEDGNEDVAESRYRDDDDDERDMDADDEEGGNAKARVAAKWRAGVSGRMSKFGEFVDEATIVDMEEDEEAAKARKEVEADFYGTTDDEDDGGVGGARNVPAPAVVRIGTMRDETHSGSAYRKSSSCSSDQAKLSGRGSSAGATSGGSKVGEGESGKYVSHALYKLNALPRDLSSLSRCLKDLSIANNAIGDTGAAAIANCLGKGAVPNLKKLDLRWNGISVQGAAALACGLQMFAFNQQQLLSTPPLSPSALDAFPASSGAGLMASCSALRISSSDWRNDSPRVGGWLPDASPRSVAAGALDSILLAGNELTDVGAAAIITVVSLSRQYPVVRTLDLSMNRIGNSVLPSLQLLVGSVPLSVLDSLNISLEWNELDDSDAVSQLVEVLIRMPPSGAALHALSNENRLAGAGRRSSAGGGTPSGHTGGSDATPTAQRAADASPRPDSTTSSMVVSATESHDDVTKLGSCSAAVAEAGKQQAPRIPHSPRERLATSLAPRTPVFNLANNDFGSLGADVHQLTHGRLLA